jgi:hypothetical protein
MSGHRLKSLAWPVLLPGCAGLALRIAFALHPVSRTSDAIALGLALIPVTILPAAWALEHAASWRAARAARREVQRATLLRHADPLSADVAALQADMRACKRAIASLVAGMDDACRAAGIARPDTEETAPLLRLVRDAGRDSA